MKSDDFLNTSLSSVNFNVHNASTTMDNTAANYTYTIYPDWWYPTIREYYPAYGVSWQSSPDRHEQAFRVAKMLYEEKLVNINKVKDFIEMVEKIFKII